MSDAVNIATAHWGKDIPPWVAVLASVCAETSQNKVAAKLGVSAALVSQVLRARYPGDMARIEDLVRGHYMAETVACPALGTLPTHECRDWQAKARAFASTHSLRVRMYKACNKCPRFLKTEAGDADA